MDATFLTAKFARIGARLKVADRPARRITAGISLDVRADRRGEFFEFAARPDDPADVGLLDVRPGDRHLLLLVREGREKSKYLCGHDERHWFVAGIPEAAPVGTVAQAKDALKPPEVRAALAGKRVRTADRDRRKNAAFVRQGEWFFLPEPQFVPDPDRVLPWEPLRRGNGGKPHWTESLYRTGGETVYVCTKYPAGVTESQHRKLLATAPGAGRWGWQVMRRNPGVYVRGRVRHPDHATIYLPVWHRVLMNTEGESRAMRNVAFLD